MRIELAKLTLVGTRITTKPPGTPAVVFLNKLNLYFHHFYFPAQLVGGFTLGDLLDLPRSQVSSRLPPGTCLHFLFERSEFLIATSPPKKLCVRSTNLGFSEGSANRYCCTYYVPDTYVPHFMIPGTYYVPDTYVL